MVKNENKQVDLKCFFELFVAVFYTWYFVPMCNAWFDTGTFKILFFSCFALGCIGLAFLNGIRLNSVFTIVGLYILIFFFIYLLDVGDANKHIRVSFTFWGTALLYFGVLDEKGKLRLGKYLLLLFGITALTSSIGVMLDNSAARTIAHAGADDEVQKAYKLMNISNIYLFQSLIYFVPILICLPKRNKKQKLVSIVLLLAVLWTILNASFTISLILYVVSVTLALCLKGTSIKRMIAISVMGIAIVVFLTNGSGLLYFLSDFIGNEQISMRLRELAIGLSTGVLEGDAGIRWDVYMASLKTFLENPFGVGVHYSYIRLENGLGYHSQLLDDLARYGVAAIAFYVAFLRSYYIHLKKEWDKLGQSHIALIIILIYLLFLILNLGFRSADESVVMLFILPVIPNMIIQYKNRKISSCEREKIQ